MHGEKESYECNLSRLRGSQASSIRTPQRRAWISYRVDTVNSWYWPSLSHWRILRNCGDISSDFPPVFLCAGKRDPLFAQSLAFQEALKRKKVPCHSLFFSSREHPDAHHGFLNLHNRECSRIAMRESLSFLPGTASSVKGDA